MSNGGSGTHYQLKNTGFAAALGARPHPSPRHRLFDRICHLLYAHLTLTVRATEELA